MTRKETATFLRLSPSTLANWASMDVGPPFTRLGGGRTLYRQDAVEAWLLSQKSGAA
ncbi:helix-turn-helix transcriptional regulator [Pseudarthrobacter scleromae]|uniref:helix-turn-helix transcriptional regulator n=1 Tax=Pseudarthrobacter scleromae TaxID=158897 RepID=UPI003635D17F